MSGHVVKVWIGGERWAYLADRRGRRRYSPVVEFACRFDQVQAAAVVAEHASWTGSRHPTVAEWAEGEQQQLGVPCAHCGLPGAIDGGVCCWAPAVQFPFY